MRYLLITEKKVFFESDGKTPDYLNNCCWINLFTTKEGKTLKNRKNRKSEKKKPKNTTQNNTTKLIHQDPAGR